MRSVGWRSAADRPTAQPAILAVVDDRGVRWVGIASGRSRHPDGMPDPSGRSELVRVTGCPIDPHPGESIMQTITLEEAQSHLSEIIDRLPQGEEVVILRDDRPVARLTGAPEQQPRPVPGRGRGMLTILSEDDEHLKDFAGYMP
jgi:antitoxin (DNA-binding transcriptional repressor) of toxin-antitoxin stability system